MKSLIPVPEVKGIWYFPLLRLGHSFARHGDVQVKICLEICFFIIVSSGLLFYNDYYLSIFVNVG